MLQLDVKLTASERNNLLVTLARLDSINGLTRLISFQFLDHLRRNGVNLSHGRMVDGFSREDWARDLSYMHARYGSCIDEQAIKVLVPNMAQPLKVRPSG